MSNDNIDIRCGVYRHYKGFYAVVLGLAMHTETKESLVVYVPLEPQEGPRIRARPLAMFFEHVEVNNAIMPRFVYIGLAMPNIEETTKDEEKPS